MDALLSRFRNLTVLLIVVVSQLLYLAYQVKSNRDERLIRVWAVSAVTPMAGVVEAIRRNTIGFLEDYFILLDVREQNRKLKSDNDRLRMENVYYRNQLSTAEHARALFLFQSQTQSKTVAARVIANSTVATAKAVFIDRGSTSGIEKSMAVVTPEGIVGKVAAVYPLVSQVLLVTDPTFKVGVQSQKGHIHGVLDCGTGACIVEQILNEEKVEQGEWFFTSGEDRIFPRGFPVGTVVSSQPGQGSREVKLSLSGDPGGVEAVLVVLRGQHQPIPAAAVPVQDESTLRMLPPPPDTAAIGATMRKPQTEADKIVERYSQLGKEQNHVYGGLGSNVPNFNVQGPAQTPSTGKQLPGATPPGQGTAAAPNSNSNAQKQEPAQSRVKSDDTPPVLGSRSNSQPSGTPERPKQVPNTGSNSALPLGAPRPKPAPPPATSTQPPPL